MLNYNVLSKKPSVFRNFSGLDVPEFDALNLKIKEKYPDYEQKRLTREKIEKEKSEKDIPSAFP
jgi:hypothetical protein